MKIVHFSDWHGKQFNLPKADIYVCTGDMLPNFPLLLFQTGKDFRMGRKAELWDPHGNVKKPDGYCIGRSLLPAREQEMQIEWIKENPNPRQVFGNPDAPVIVVRGNHDFCDLNMYFFGEVYEIHDDPTQVFDVKGMRFGGARGIPFIIGEWADEIHRSDLASRMEKIPYNIDALVTHCPPRGILDRHGYEDLGCDGISRFVTKQGYAGGSPLRAHFFGHIHEHGGKIEKRGETQFSNAATTFTELEV